MATKISAKILADSTSPQGMRITTFLLTYPRIIHSELMTHRVFSRNSASSRAIPFNKIVKMVEEDPFIPIAWQKDHKGMQGTEYITDNLSIQFARSSWLSAKDNAIKGAKSLYSTENGYESVTKQLCNRLLEPFMWHTALITATEFSNFFELRCPKYEYYDMLTGNQQFFKSKKDWLQYYNNKPLPKAKHISKIPANDVEWLQINKSQAEIHMQALAEAMWDAMNESTPKELEEGEWHIPFGDKIDDGKLAQSISPNKALIYSNQTLKDLRLKVCIARAARLSYMTFGQEIDYQKDIELHDRLLKDHHMSPMEHIAKAMSDEEYDLYIKGKLSFREEDSYDLEEPLFTQKGWCDNLRGFISYRHLIENNLPIT